VAAQRNKHTYDLRVRPTRYKVGDWVLYFNPRKYRGKQDKWRRQYTGPYLVVGVPGPVNVTLQSGPKAKTFLTRIDKVKAYTGSQVPKSWITSVSTPPTLPETPEKWKRMRACRGRREKLRRLTWRTLRKSAARVLVKSCSGGRR